MTAGHEDAPSPLEPLQTLRRSFCQAAGLGGRAEVEFIDTYGIYIWCIYMVYICGIYINGIYIYALYIYIYLYIYYIYIYIYRV